MFDSVSMRLSYTPNAAYTHLSCVTVNEPVQELNHKLTDGTFDVIRLGRCLEQELGREGGKGKPTE